MPLPLGPVDALLLLVRAVLLHHEAVVGLRHVHCLVDIVVVHAVPNGELAPVGVDGGGVALVHEVHAVVRGVVLLAGLRLHRLLALDLSLLTLYLYSTMSSPCLLLSIVTTFLSYHCKARSVKVTPAMVTLWNMCTALPTTLNLEKPPCSLWYFAICCDGKPRLFCWHVPTAYTLSMYRTMKRDGEGNAWSNAMVHHVPATPASFTRWRMAAACQP